MPPSSVRLGTLSSTSLSINKAMSAEEKEQLTQKYHSLKVKLKAIEDELITQLNELKGICLEEAVSLKQFSNQWHIPLFSANNRSNAQGDLHDPSTRRKAPSGHQESWNCIQNRSSNHREFEWGRSIIEVANKCWCIEFIDWIRYRAPKIAAVSRSPYLLRWSSFCHSERRKALEFRVQRRKLSWLGSAQIS